MTPLLHTDAPVSIDYGLMVNIEIFHEVGLNEVLYDGVLLQA